MNNCKNKSRTCPELDQLQDLLEKQIKLAQGGNISRLELLSRQTDRLVEKIVKTKIIESAEFEDRRKKLQKLYKDLHLAVTTHKADTAEKLKQTRNVKKTIAAYRSNI